MIVKTEINTYLSVIDEYGRIITNQILVVAKAGHGKTLATEQIAEKLHRLGCLVLVIADPKDEMEFCYQMFKPEEKYHLNLCRKFGVTPSGKKVKIYHPFTFNLPSTPLPEMNLFTFSLKDLGRKEWGLLAETNWDTETMTLLLKASAEISKEDGLYGIMHYIQNAVKGKKSGKEKKADPKNFYLDASSGTLKEVTKISGYLQPFKKDYFLSKDNCPLKIDWKKILTDQEHYHVFVSKWVKDEKLKDFIVLALLNGIIENKDLLKHPIVVVIPEIRKQTPFRADGHKKFLAENIKDCLSLMRSSGRGMNSLLDTQVWSGVDEDVRNSATLTFFGELGGGKDIENVIKAYPFFKGDFKNKIEKMDYPRSYVVSGVRNMSVKDIDEITFIPPSSMHGEEHYNFIEMYKKHFPEKMRSYHEIISMMKKMYAEEEAKFREKVKRKEKEEKERRERERKAKEEAKKEREKGNGKPEKKKEREIKDKQKIMKICYEMKQENPDMSFRQIGKKLELNHKTVSKYVSEYAKIKEQEDAKDFEEKVLEDLNEDNL